MRRGRPLAVALAVHAAFILACLPPTTYGLRGPGDLPEAGTGAVGGGLGVATNGLAVGAVDGEWALSEHLGVAGSVAGVTGGGQGQVELRYSTDRAAPTGVSASLGASVVTTVGLWPAGPTASVSGRWAPTDALFVYGGAKVNPVINLGFALTWVEPVVGVCTRDRPVRLGAELVGFVPATADSTWSPGLGAQGYLRWAPGRREQR